MLIASLALAGIPPLTGFFSKDAILWQAFMASGLGQVLYGVALVTVLLTAFYSFRLVFMVFFGKDNVDHKHVHPHESPWVMTVPLIALAIPAIFLGFLASKLTNFTAYEYLGEVLGRVNEYHEFAGLEVNLMFVSVGVAIAGIITAFVFYFKPSEIAANLANSVKPLYTLLLKKYYFDEIYNAIFVEPTRKASSYLWDKSEVKVIDGMGVNGTARFFMGAGRFLSFLQSGYLQHYTLWLAGGVLVLLALFIGFRFN
jgi:NADH-quinone oxidoreductase subunit L